jgi:hypothetical protein
MAGPLRITVPEFASGIEFADGPVFTRGLQRELEAQWNTALERVAQVERHLAELEAQAASRPRIDRETLMRLAHDLPAARNARTT